MSEKIIFYGSLPPIGSAWKRHGGGEGVRVTIEIPEAERANAAPLEDWVNVLLKFTVEVEESGILEPIKNGHKDL